MKPSPDLDTLVAEKVMGCKPSNPRNYESEGLHCYCENRPHDYFDSSCTSFGKTLWKRKSDEGIKWHIFEEKELKLWKDVSECE